MTEDHPQDAPHANPPGSASPGDPVALGPAADPGHGAGGAPGGTVALHRARHGRMVGGVCAGVAETFGIDVTLVRVAAVVFALAGGLAVPIYVALWVLVPEEGTGHTILPNLVRGPRLHFATATASAETVNAQGGAAMSPCPRSDEHDWSQAGPYRSWYPGRWRGGWPDPDQGMRVGDTERSQVSDLLSKHYAAGRLDDEEFNQRMTQAMGAKTRADLSGLLGDLPPVEPAQSSVTRHRHRRGFGSFLMLCLTVFVVGSIASAFFWVPRPHFAWVVLAVGAFFLLR